MRYVFWWDSPCKGMIGVLREFCRLAPDTVVITGETGRRREAMGWQAQAALFLQHCIIPNQPYADWCRSLVEKLQHYPDAFHVVNGLVRPIFAELLNQLIARRIPYATMTEAPCNMYSGSRRLMKCLLSPIVQPLRHRRFANTARAFISLSGGKALDVRNIERLGFPKEKIFPFGYFTDEDPSFCYRPVADGKIHLLCPGLLEEYKGVDILIAALGLLKQKGITGFHCHINGNGSQKPHLAKMIAELQLQELATLHGALGEGEYRQLLSGIDILVAPGRREPWGIRINEAIQRGQAVVTSDHLGASVLIERSGGGGVFQSGSVADLGAKLEPLLVNFQELERAKAANRQFKEQISCASAAQRLYDILNGVSSSAGSGMGKI